MAGGLYVSGAFALVVWLAAGRLAASAPAPEAAQPDAAVAEALAKLGLVDVQTLVPDVLVRLKYAHADNFMGEVVYRDVRGCYLRPEPAAMIARAQAELSRRNPGLRLLMADCTRPRDVQRRMYGLVRDTPMRNYVARPEPGSMHNHGAAVDLTIADAEGNQLDMGTPLDHFGPLTQPRLDARHLKAGKLTAEQVANRRLLREVMVKAGFRPLEIEWWHFVAHSPKEVRRRYPIVEAFPTASPASAAAGAPTSPPARSR